VAEKKSTKRSTTTAKKKAAPLLRPGFANTHLRRNDRRAMLRR